MLTRAADAACLPCTPWWQAYLASEQISAVAAPTESSKHTHADPWDDATQVCADSVQTILLDLAFLVHDQVGGVTLQRASKQRNSTVSLMRPEGYQILLHQLLRGIRQYTVLRGRQLPCMLLLQAQRRKLLY